jgi:carbon-monoxide dehydrogenase large subunit
VHGDTDKVQFGMGTYGSRSGAVGISAIVKALDKIEAKAKKVAAHLMEAAEGDIVFKDGKFTVPAPTSRRPGATSRSTPISPTNSWAGARARAEGRGVLRSVNFTFPAGCHICEVEVDPQTGESEIVHGPRSTISAPSSIR